jgi:transcriptional regulator with XRE-family HTH domain
MADTPLTKQLKMLRKRNHYSQEYVAKYIGTSRGNYSHFETGRTIPSNDILGKLSKLYQVPFINLIKLSAISKREELQKLVGAEKVEIDGVIYDNPKSEKLDPIYLEFINNCPEMTDKELKEWMEPEAIEIVYYFHLLSERDKSFVVELLRLIAKFGSRENDHL